MERRIFHFGSKYMVFITATAFVALVGCSSNSDSKSGSSTSSSSSSTSSNTSSSSSSSSPSGSTGPVVEQSALSVVDFDGDGYPDVLWAPLGGQTLYWYRNDGSVPASFSKSTLISATETIATVEAVDIDGDGDTDVLFSLTPSKSLVWYENIGGNVFNPSFTQNALLTDGQDVNPIMANMNSDGSLDVLSVSREQNTLTLYEGSNVLPLSFASRDVVENIGGVFFFDVTNLNGDAGTDILVASKQDNAIYWYENDEALSPNFSQHTVASDAEAIYAFAAVDLDTDGYVDVVAASYTNNTLWWNRNGGELSPNFSQIEISDQADSVYWLDIANLDNDADPDIVVASSATNTLSWFENDGNVGVGLGFTEHAVAQVTDGIYAIKIADIDQDGDLDILFVSTQQADIVMLLNNGAVVPSFIEEPIKLTN